MKNKVTLLVVFASFALCSSIYKPQVEFEDNYKVKISNYLNSNEFFVLDQFSNDGLKISPMIGVFSKQDRTKVDDLSDLDSIKTYTESENPPGNYFSFSEWSPDNNSFIEKSFDEKKRCGDKRLLGYIIMDKKIILNSIFEKNYVPCSMFTWSQDGKEVIIHNSEPKIFRWNIYSNNVEKYQFNFQENEVLNDLFWGEDDFYYVIQKQVNENTWSKTLYESRLNQIQSRDPIYSSNNYLSLLMSTKESFYFSESTGQEGETTIYEWQKKEKLLKKLYQISGFLEKKSTNKEKSILALEFSFLHEIKNRVYLFDNQRKKVLDKGEVYHLIGWKDVINGFLSISNNEGNKKIIIFRPN